MGKQGSFIKRVTDILISIITLILFSPILIILMIAIKLDSKGSIFFLHERTGLNGKTFKMIKFRGMVDNALAAGPELTQPNDPRITRVGKILRRTSIDEIPQVINVLKGEMSIIGPRPEITSITSRYDDFQKKVFEFKPGITGISQINGRQMLTPEQRTKMEIDYYSNENFWGDLKIFFMTFAVILTNEGNI
jgi:lipopolysaccharide/colanic/teichoic acid biosynthesis glycosyltransferase